MRFVPRNHISLKPYLHALFVAEVESQHRLTYLSPLVVNEVVKDRA